MDGNLYIDTATGTYGAADDLVILDSESSARFLSEVDDLSDGQIALWPALQV